MNYVDIVLGIFLAWGLYKGIKNGLLLEVASIVALIAGIYGAIHFSYFIGDYITDKWNWNVQYVNLIAIILTFIVIVLVVRLAGKLLTKVADFAMLGWLNKLAGGLFGALKVAVVLGALLVFFHKTNKSFNLIKEETLESSILYQPVKEVGSLVFSLVLKEETDEDS